MLYIIFMEIYFRFFYNIIFSILVQQHPTITATVFRERIQMYQTLIHL